MSEKISQKQLRNTEQKTIDTKTLKDEDVLSDDLRYDISELPPELAQRLEEIGLSDDQKIIALEAISAEHFSGPLPHPKILAGYENVIPGGADRILSMAELEAKHRHDMDNKCHKTDSRDSLLGIVSAFTLTTMIIVGGIVVIIKVPGTLGTIAGLLMSGSGIGTVLTTFIKSTKATWKMDNSNK